MKPVKPGNNYERELKRYLLGLGLKIKRSQTRFVKIRAGGRLKKLRNRIEGNPEDLAKISKNGVLVPEMVKASLNLHN